MVSASRTAPPLSTVSLRNIQITLLTLITKRKKMITLIQAGTLNSSQPLLVVTTQNPYNQQVLMLPLRLQRILVISCRTAAKMCH